MDDTSQCNDREEHDRMKKMVTCTMKREIRVPKAGFREDELHMSRSKIGGTSSHTQPLSFSHGDDGESAAQNSKYSISF